MEYGIGNPYLFTCHFWNIPQLDPGVLSSVHAFAQSAIGPMFFVFIGVTFIISLAFMIKRWEDLKSEGHMTSLLSGNCFFW